MKICLMTCKPVIAGSDSTRCALNLYTLEIERFFNLRITYKLVQAFNPRKYHWRLIILVALLAAAGLILAEFIPEGAPAKGNRLLVFSVYTGLETAGVLLVYKLFRNFLGIFKD